MNRLYVTPFNPNSPQEWRVTVNSLYVFLGPLVYSSIPWSDIIMKKDWVICDLRPHIRTAATHSTPLQTQTLPQLKVHSFSWETINNIWKFVASKQRMAKTGGSNGIWLKQGRVQTKGAKEEEWSSIEALLLGTLICIRHSTHASV